MQLFACYFCLFQGVQGLPGLPGLRGKPGPQVCCLSNLDLQVEILAVIAFFYVISPSENQSFRTSKRVLKAPWKCLNNGLCDLCTINQIQILLNPCSRSSRSVSYLYVHFDSLKVIHRNCMSKRFL